MVRLISPTGCNKAGCNGPFHRPVIGRETLRIIHRAQTLTGILAAPCYDRDGRGDVTTRAPLSIVCKRSKDDQDDQDDQDDDA